MILIVMTTVMIRMMLFARYLQHLIYLTAEKNTEIDPAYFHRPEPSRRLLPGQARSIFLTADWLRGSSDANDDVLASADGGIT